MRVGWCLMRRAWWARAVSLRSRRVWLRPTAGLAAAPPTRARRGVPWGAGRGGGGMAAHFDRAGIQLDGTARSLTFDWASGRPEGQRLRTSARLEDVAITPQSKDFILGGLIAGVSGSESDLSIDVHSRTARLELTQ